MLMDKRVLVIYSLLILTTLAAYHGVAGHGFVDFDDDVYITENSHIRDGVTIQGLYWAFTTGHAANWHPLTWISHMLDIQTFGLNPHGHHLTNLLLHITNVLLLFFVLNLMTEAPWRSAFVAALFALHPLHVESVAWVSERKDVLSALFWFLTLAAYCYYVKRSRFGSYPAVVALFALGLMAKPMLVTLPFVLLLLDYWPLRRFGEGKSLRPIGTEANEPVSAGRKKGKSARRTAGLARRVGKPRTSAFQWESIHPLILEKIPLFALAMLSCAATYIAQSRGGAVPSSEIYTPQIRLANAAVSYLRYIGKAIWPENLAVFYPHPGFPPLWQVLGAVLFLAVAMFAVIRAAGKYPYLPVGWLWFTGTLVPVIGIVQVGAQAMADRYTYIPSIGLFIMAAWGVPELFRRAPRAKAVLGASSVVCIALLLILSRNQVGYWRDSITLFDHTLDVTKDNYTVYNNRGKVYEALGDHARAVADFDRALRICPGFALAHSNRGNALHSLGNDAEAVADFDLAIQADPKFAAAYNNRGNARHSLGDNVRAIEDFDRAIELEPSLAGAYNGRGLAHSSTGDYVRAIEDFNRAVEINPLYAEAYNSRGLARNATGDYSRAIGDFDMAIQINPKLAAAYNNRGNARDCLGDHGHAVEDFDRAVEINPAYADAYNNRGIAYDGMGNRTRAVEDFDRAIAINPGYKEAYYNRGSVHASLGNEKQALEDLKRAAGLGFKKAAESLRNQGVDW